MPHNPLMLLRLPTPLPLSLSLKNSPTIVMLKTVLRPKLTNVPVESRKIYLTLLKRQNTLIQPLPALRVSCSVKTVRISQISRMKLKSRRIINQQLLRRNRLRTLRFFNHDIPSFTTIYINRIAFYKYRIPAHRKLKKAEPKPSREAKQNPRHDSAVINLHRKVK